MTGPAMLDITLAGLTHVGARDHNEDALRHGALPEGWYAVLSDGAGGHSNGAIASDLAVRMCAAELTALAGRGDVPRAALGPVVEAANDAINRMQQGRKGQRRMHATLVMLWISRPGAATPQQAIWAHVGDSRLYLLRHGRIVHVTRDDSVVQDMVDAGLIAADQARHHPRRNQLAGALGSEEPVTPRVCDASWTLRDGDAFLLCSDGWYDALEPAEIEATLASAGDAVAWLADMQARVLRHARPKQDNLSAIAVWVGNPAEVTRISP
jgi:serine/threonine protein phosphatase PrpC